MNKRNCSHQNNYKITGGYTQLLDEHQYTVNFVGQRYDLRSEFANGLILYYKCNLKNGLENCYKMYWDRHGTIIEVYQQTFCCLIVLQNCGTYWYSSFLSINIIRNTQKANKYVGQIRKQKSDIYKHIEVMQIIISMTSFNKLFKNIYQVKCFKE